MLGEGHVDNLASDVHGKGQGREGGKGVHFKARRKEARVSNSFFFLS